jgi:hypothetical protein
MLYYNPEDNFHHKASPIQNMNNTDKDSFHEWIQTKDPSAQAVQDFMGPRLHGNWEWLHSYTEKTILKTKLVHLYVMSLFHLSWIGINIFLYISVPKNFLMTW